MNFLKSLIIVFLALLSLSCNNSLSNTHTVINRGIIEVDTTLMVLKDSLILNGNEGNWYYNDKLFSGFAVKYYANNSLKEKTGFFNGKKQGIYKFWFENGQLKLESNYHQNILVGAYTAWWENGIKALEANYKNGEKDGPEIQWYNTGQIAKKRQLVNGKENGLQKAWLENGKLYVNYEAKNGRIFGMRRANSCYKLESENVID